MEEHKAAAYYEELVQKGGAAARFKQGLGYGSAKASELPIAKADTHSLLSNFVRQASPGRAATIHKEIALEGIRNKLQKPQHTEASDKKRCSRSASLEVCPDSIDKIRVRNFCDRRSRSPLRRSRSSSGSPLGEGTEGRQRRRGLHLKKVEGSSRRHSRKRGRTPLSDGSSEDDRRSRRQRSPPPIERRTHRMPQDDRYGSKDGHSKYTSRHYKRKSRSRSRSRSFSPQKVGGRKDHKQHKRSMQIYTSKTSLKEESVAKAGSKEKVYRAPTKESDPKALAEKVKAKMKLQLTETVAKDKAKGFSGEWERFDFDKNAPLDDDAKLDYFGDGTGAQDDTKFLQNTGHSFLSSATQAKREADVEAAHETAIFGTSVKTSDGLSKKSMHRGPGLPEMGNRKTADKFNFEKQNTKVSPPDASALSEKVLEMQQVSWQERVRKIKAAKGGGAVS